MANEKRLIDANALRGEIYEYVFPITTNNLMGAADSYYRILHLLENAPTVDAVEVVHGEWDVITDDCMFDVIYQCSVCKEEFVTNDGTPAENLWHYCPYCGAKMDGKRGQENDA